jgi:hypothetical protein
LPQLPFVGHDLRQGRIEIRKELALRESRLMGQQLERLVDEGVQIRRGAPTPGIANELEQALGDLLATVGLALDQREVPREVLEDRQRAELGIPRPLPECFGAPGNRRERIVQLVGNAGR